eukprot:g13308.t1
MSAAADGEGGGGMGEDADDDTSSAVATKPKKVNSELDDLVGEMAGRAGDEPVILPRGAGITPMAPGPIKADPIPGMDDDDIPGKILLSPEVLAEQQKGLEKIAQQLRRERLDKEAEDAITFGFCPRAELWNGRSAMFGITVGMLTELWTGQSIPQQLSRSNTFSALTLLLTLALIKHFSKPESGAFPKDGTGGSRGERVWSTSRPKVDAAFLRRISRLLKVMVPGPFSLEAGCLVAVAGLLLARTSLDVVMLNLTTTIERAIVARNKGGFKLGLSRFARLCVPVAVVNSLLKYCQSELSLRFRQRLTEHVMSKYMKGFNFYAVSNLDDRISNADQAITQDVERFADSVAELYSNITKPVLDMLVYVRRLSDKVDTAAPTAMIAYLLLSGVALGALRKPTGMYTALVAQQEGKYRFVNSRLLTNAQEIAFYKGNVKEKQVLLGVFDKLVCVTRRSERFRHSLGVLDSVVAKYFATIVGWTVVSRPFVNRDHPRHASSTPAEVYQDYHASGRMMLNLSAALGRLVLSGRELARLSGFSSRVTGLIDVIDDVNRGVYKRGKDPSTTDPAATASSDASALPAAGAQGIAARASSPREGAATAAVATVAAVAADAEMAQARIPPLAHRNAGVAGVNLAAEHSPSSVLSRTTATAASPSAISSSGHDPSGLHSVTAESFVALGQLDIGALPSEVRGQPELAPEGSAGSAAAPAEGVGEDGIGLAGSEGWGAGSARLERQGSILVNEDSIIEFTDVPLVTPTGEVLIEALSFKVEAGMNVLVAGPNGSGKSSLFRVLGGLWPLRGGTLLKPPGSRLFYVPQRPYLALGTLRDQVIYPHTRQEAATRGVTDGDLLSVLESVRLGYLLDREGGWDAVRDWNDVLSGGEKQRLALSRLFYHRPQFAILDECTSAVSVDVEGEIYSLAARNGITLFTVSHRKSLWKHHSYLLRFDGVGGYEFKSMSDIGVAEQFGS